MTPFKSAAKLWLRAWYLDLIYGVFILAYIAFAIYSNSASYIDFEKDTLAFSMYAFAVFAFLGFEYCVKVKKSGLSECLRATKSGMRNMIAAQAKILLITVSLFFAAAAILNGIIFAAGDTNFPAFLPQLFATVLLNYFLLPLTGAVFGLFFANFTNRLIAYLLLVLITLLGSPLITGIDAMIYEITKIDLSYFFRLFEFFEPDLTWTPVYAWGNSLVPQRWCILLFWIFLLGAVIFYKTSAQKKPVKLLRGAVALFLAAVCLFTAVLPGSKVLLGSDNMAESATMADSTYYYEHPDGKKAKREVPFQISEYTADLRVFTKLHAKVTMKIDTPDLEEYTFTLYHGYKIKSAKDQNGNALQFKQEEDHFTVAPNGNTTEITVKYSGFSPVFYSNAQGIFLPGYFAYLPQSGLRPLYDSANRGFYRCEYNEDTVFNMKINSLQKVYCNLEETGRNTFSGTGYPSLFMGAYAEYTTKQGIRVIYPYMDSSINGNTIEEDTAPFYGSKCLPSSVKTIFIEPDTKALSAYNIYFQDADQLITTEISMLEENYGNQTADPYKNEIASLYERYLEPENRNDFLMLAEALKGTGFEYFVDILNKYGEEEGLERVKTYLEDESDTRTSYEFFSDELGV